MSQPPDNLTHSPMGLQSTDGTPADPLPYLLDNLRARRDRLLDAMLQQHGTGGYYASPARPLLPPPTVDPAWTPVAADPWAPAEPLAYRYSDVARDRRALFDGPPGVVCPRCGTHFTDCAAVHIAPPGLPRIVVHLSCLEAGDEVQPRPEAL